MANEPSYHLIVTHPVPGHDTGTHVTDPDLVVRLLETHPHHVVKVSAGAASGLDPRSGRGLET